MPEFEYREERKMNPRPGVKYGTTYYKQSSKQREALAEHIVKVCDEIANLTLDSEANAELINWLLTPDDRFKRDRNSDKPGKYKTPLELLEDSKGEAQGFKRNGDPKDFAQAPIDRWNKLWENVEDYQIEMVTERPKNYNPQFDKLFRR